jgi:hypothetical protein
MKFLLTYIAVVVLVTSASYANSDNPKNDANTAADTSVSKTDDYRLYLRVTGGDNRNWINEDFAPYINEVMTIYTDYVRKNKKAKIKEAIYNLWAVDTKGTSGAVVCITKASDNHFYRTHSGDPLQNGKMADYDYKNSTRHLEIFNDKFLSLDPGTNIIFRDDQSFVDAYDPVEKAGIILLNKEDSDGKTVCYVRGLIKQKM